MCRNVAWKQGFSLQLRGASLGPACFETPPNANIGDIFYSVWMSPTEPAATHVDSKFICVLIAEASRTNCEINSGNHLKRSEKYSKPTKNATRSNLNVHFIVSARISVRIRWISSVVYGMLACLPFRAGSRMYDQNDVENGQYSRQLKANPTKKWKRCEEWITRSREKYRKCKNSTENEWKYFGWKAVFGLDKSDLAPFLPYLGCW